ncbi:hypothetical protein [Streptomyces europaeiscabiei]|uniref:hypothetical protein n=1 Tax=Streptomyces europaeiscabiei TaxID=146819 RepID=UPI0029BCBD29|nr:hypothetical protein [Streptomyces europaeiscabiei]MDX2530366.1 hypothetical protein [Streptomyces europaeiscabiei]MDX3714641.1 hypothetical protein [Streptomyces europaeiscabiei]MDX3864225.1 hypothetical protein [Streptomyces europaeiscabiei]MDX3871693.1 hypothetical protein [Streptomyces europaeiscabiei]
MSTLDYPINERPSPCLRFLRPGAASRYGATRVTEVVARPLTELPDTLGAPCAGTPFENRTLFLATLDPHRLAQAGARTLDHLIRLLERREAAGLVLATPATTCEPSPRPPSRPPTACGCRC